MQIYSNPEFLSAKTAIEDFANEKKVLIGGSDSEGIEKLKKLYASKGATNIYFTSHTEAESIKYIANVFFAVKLACFNEFFDVCQERKVNFQLCADLASDLTGWINTKHIQVPGTDGYFGYGGSCLPKDIEAYLVKYNHMDLFTIAGAIKSNRKRRRNGAKVKLPKRDEYLNIDLTKGVEHKRGKQRKGSTSNRKEDQVLQSAVC